MYTTQNFKTKKALKEALAKGEEVRAFQPGPFGPKANFTGTDVLEGPHYPEPHRWYAAATIENGRVVKVK